MEPELKRQLEEIHALARDNHRMLRSIRREQLLSLVAKIFFWAIIVFAPFYLYSQYVKPYVGQVQSGQASESILDFLGLPSSADIQKLINSYKAGQ